MSDDGAGRAVAPEHIDSNGEITDKEKDAEWYQLGQEFKVSLRVRCEEYQSKELQRNVSILWTIFAAILQFLL